VGFWKKRGESVPLDQRVDQVLDEAEKLAGRRPKSALQLLDGLKGDAYPLVTFGGTHHQRFSGIAASALGTTEAFPGVSALPWSRWVDVPTVADVLTLAGEGSEPVLYLFEPPDRFSRGPATELAGLKLLLEDGGLAMVVVGEMNTFLRREPLLSLTGRVDPSSVEILEELETSFRAAGYRSISIVG